MYTDLSLVAVLQTVDSFLVEQGLAKTSIDQYRRYGFEAFRTHFCEIGTELYSEKESWNCVLQSRQLFENGLMSDRQFRMIRRVHEMMKMFAHTGEIHYFDLDSWGVHNPCPSLQKVMDEFLLQREEYGCSELTVRWEKSTVRNFLLYTEHEGKMDCDSWTSELVDDYIVVLQEKWLSGLTDPLCTLRSFLRYCNESGRTKFDLSHVLDVKAATKSKVKQGFSTDEIQRMLLSIDRSTDLGKRNYAMIVLAVHTGLRQIDILNLKLDDLHWREAEIRIVQHKTKRQVILPLDQETGDAIADYLLNARPRSTSNFVFLRTIAPYKNLKVGSCIGSRMVQKYAALANVSWNKSERKGFHSFRRSLGREMLEKDVPLNTISEVLGHAHRNSTKPYLAIDVAHLRECAISLNGIECSKGVFQ